MKANPITQVLVMGSGSWVIVFVRKAGASAYVWEKDAPKVVRRMMRLLRALAGWKQGTSSSVHSFTRPQVEAL